MRAGGYEKSWARLTNLALGRMAETIAFDSQLADALKEHSAPATGAVPAQGDGAAPVTSPTPPGTSEAPSAPPPAAQ